MIFGKTTFLPQLISAAMALCLLHTKPVLADNYPSKIITIVVPTAPGGANDAMARIIAQGLSQKLGQGVVVETVKLTVD